VININFAEFMSLAENWGLIDSLLPFILIFTLTFAVLQRTHILGEGRKNLNVIIALVLALTTVIPHITGVYPKGKDAVEIINRAIPNLTLVVIGLITLLLLIGIFGGQPSPHSGAIFSYIVIFAILFNVFFNNSFPTLAPVVLMITLFITIISVFRKHEATGSSQLVPGWIVIIMFLIVFFAFSGAAGWTEIPSWLNWITDETSQTIMIIAIVVLALIGYTGKEN
jgi:hypothetical protein